MFKKKFNTAVLIALSIILGAIVLYTEIKSNLIDPPQYIEPFAVEHYEIIDQPNSIFRIYFNREILAYEEIELSITLGSNSSEAHTNYFLTKDTKKRIYEIDFLKKDSINPVSADFVDLFKNHCDKLDTIHTVWVSYAQGSASNNAFTKGGFWFHYEVITKYSPKDRAPKELSYRYSTDGHLWRYSLWRFSEGIFNEKDQKEGDWKWYYSNGNLMATTRFEKDKVIEPIVVYRYTGEVQDSIFFENGKKVTSKSFDLNGNVIN